MSSNSSLTYPDGFIIGEIVWARRNHDGIYWPGRITFITNSPNDTLSPDNLQYQSCSYLIQFFGFNQTNWTFDVLPYQQYRDYLSKNLLIHYDSKPQIKYQFSNAINQADYAHPIRSENSTSKNAYVPTSITDCHDSSNYYYQYPSNSSYNTQSNYCSCCPHPYLQPPIEPMSNSLLPLNNEYHPQTENSPITNLVIIITTKSYSNSSFISYLFNCLFNFIHRSIVYLDDLSNYQHPNTSHISYLICLDHFDTTIQQILDRTILNNLNGHMSYVFLVINAPSNQLVRHLYSTVMDKRTILILHYHSTFENDPLLLCSGNRTTFEMLESSLLKYLCLKVKYIEPTEDDEEQLYCISPESQPNNITMIDIPNRISDSHCFINNQNATEEYLLLTSTMKSAKKLGKRRVIKNLSKGTVKRKYKQRVRRNNMISTSSPEYYVQNILENFDPSK